METLRTDRLSEVDGGSFKCGLATFIGGLLGGSVGGLAGIVWGGALLGGACVSREYGRSLRAELPEEDLLV